MNCVSVAGDRAAEAVMAARGRGTGHDRGSSRSYRSGSMLSAASESLVRVAAHVPGAKPLDGTQPPLAMRPLPVRRGRPLRGWPSRETPATTPSERCSTRASPFGGLGDIRTERRPADVRERSSSDCKNETRPSVRLSIHQRARRESCSWSRTCSKRTATSSGKGGGGPP